MRRAIYRFLLVAVIISRFFQDACFSDIKEAYSEFKMPIASDPLEKAAFIYFDFESWAGSKITGKKIKEVLINKLHPGKP